MCRRGAVLYSADILNSYSNFFFLLFFICCIRSLRNFQCEKSIKTEEVLRQKRQNLPGSMAVCQNLKQEVENERKQKNKSIGGTCL